MTKPLKWFLYIFAGAVTVAVLAIILAKFMPSPKEEVKPQPHEEKKPALEVNKKDLPKENLPGIFPQDIPIESGAGITQNFTVNTPDGRTQFTRGFITKKTLAENYKIYSDYLNKNSWKITASIDQPAIKVLSATNGTNSIKIDITENSTLNQKTVVISLITDKETK